MTNYQQPNPPPDVVIEESKARPTIIFRQNSAAGTGGWIFVDVPNGYNSVMPGRYSSYRTVLSSAGWIRNDAKKWWMTKDDDLVNDLRAFLLPRDIPILERRLAQRAELFKRSYAVTADSLPSESLLSIYPPSRESGRLELFPFQTVTPPELVFRNILLADEMGLGKTVQAIMAINFVQPKNVLIVVPNMVVYNWYDELEKWLTLNPRPMIYICPWSRLVKMDLTVYWDMVIVDEAHYAKNPESQRSKAFSGLKAKHKMCLTGTPILGKPIELWPIVQWLDPYILGTKTDFEERYCDRKLKSVRTRQGYKNVWDMSGYKNVARLQRKLRETIMISREKRNVLTQLPQKIRTIIQLDGLSPTVINMEQTLLALWKEAKKGGNKLEIWNNIFAMRKEAALLKVPQINAVIDELLEQTKNGEPRPMVIWAHHHEVIDAIYDHFASKAGEPVRIVTLDGRKRPEERSHIVKEFQSGAIDILVGGISAAGVGITLTRADICLFAELDWTPANMVQAEDRLHRIGQESTVNVYYCVAPNSVDGRIARILADKQRVIDEFTDLDSILSEV